MWGARRLTSRPVKEPIIFIAGRMVPEKGILEAALAIADILPFYPEWKLVIAGARRFEDAPAGSYEAKVGKAIAPLGDQAEMLGFIPPDAVRRGKNVLRLLPVRQYGKNRWEKLWLRHLLGAVQY